MTVPFGQNDRGREVWEGDVFFFKSKWNFILKMSSYPVNAPCINFICIYKHMLTHA